MENSVVEVLVDRKVPFYIPVAYIACIVLTALSAVSYFFGIGFLAIIPVILFGILTYYVGLRRKLEYEYAYFDKELNVDVIYNMTKRKRVKTFDLGKMEICAPSGSSQLDEFKNRTVKTYDFGSNKEENQSQVYVMYLEGNEKIIFEPSEKMLQAIYHVSPRKVFQA